MGTGRLEEWVTVVNDQAPHRHPIMLAGFRSHHIAASRNTPCDATIDFHHRLASFPATSLAEVRPNIPSFVARSGRVFVASTQARYPASRNQFQLAGMGFARLPGQDPRLRRRNRRRAQHRSAPSARGLHG